jgi:hypothetical protein
MKELKPQELVESGPVHQLENSIIIGNSSGKLKVSAGYRNAFI